MTELPEIEGGQRNGIESVLRVVDCLAGGEVEVVGEIVEEEQSYRIRWSVQVTERCTVNPAGPRTLAGAGGPVERLIFPGLLAATALTVLSVTFWLPEGRRREFLREAALVISAALLYFLIRGATEGRAAEAVARALDLQDLERALGLAFEADLQALIIDHDRLVDLANAVYIGLHWPVIAAIAIWLHAQDLTRYRNYRNAMMLSGLVGLIIFAMWPMAPPRLADPELIDTVVERSNAYRLMQPPQLTNQYAAMPSLHLGWNLLMAIALVRESKHIALQLVGWATPVVMLFAMVATANHFVLDGLAGAMIVVLALGTVEVLFPRIREMRAQRGLTGNAEVIEED